MRILILCLLGWGLPFLLLAQSNASKADGHALPGMLSMTEEGKGIKGITGLFWEQIKQKAKQENKYIFIDAYTTWCGPCKMMDEYVYANDSESNFF